MKLTSILFFSIAAIIVCLAPSLDAQVVPYKASGSNAQFDAVNQLYFGTGKGTHLGKHQIEGNIVYGPDFLVYPFTPPGVFAMGSFSGSQTATAANGDTMTSNLSGEVLLVFESSGLVTGTWYPSFEITGGTGRFENASGTVDGEAFNPPFDPTTQFWAFDWFIDGKFSMGKKGKK